MDFLLFQTEYCHMLNGTMCAVTRVICVLMELNQTEEGINVPKALQPYMPPSKFKRSRKPLVFSKKEILTFFFFSEYREFIPFVNSAPIDEAESKKAKKQKDGMKKKEGEKK